MFRGARNVAWKSNMCSRNSRVTLCVSYRSHSGAEQIWYRCDPIMTLRVSGGAVRILILLLQPYPLGTLCVSDRSGCGAVLILADSLRSWQRGLMSSVEGPSTTILHEEFHGAVPEVRKKWSSRPRSCRGPCEKMLRRSWWNPVRGPCMNLNKFRWEDLVKILLTSVKSFCMILHRSLSEDLVEILVILSKRSLH